MTHTPAPNLGLPYRAEPHKPVEINDLEEFQERHRGDGVWVRAVLVALGFALVSANLWVGLQSYNALTTDVDASRLAMSELHEQTMVRLDELEKRLDALEGRLPPPAVALASATPAP
jgi:hypothetical protein